MAFTKKTTVSDFANELRAFGYEVQLIENTLFEIMTSRLLDYATDASLDILGVIAGAGDCPRQGLNDADYRVKIKAQIAMNYSCGEPDAMIIALQSLTDTAWQRFREYFPACEYMEFSGTTTPDFLYSRMKKIKAGGVRLDIARVHPTTDFRFAAGDTIEHNDSDHGFSDDAQTTGGKLSTILT